MPFVETAYGALFYAQRGLPTPALVTIHGAGGSHQHWGLQLQALRHGVRVIGLDLPGHGRSPGPGRSSVDDYCRVLLAALDALGLEHVVLAGHSMGGAIALAIALTTPERVTGLVLVGTGARLPVMPALFAHLERDPALAARLVVERAYARSADPALRAAGEIFFTQVDPQVFRGDLLACAAFDVMGHLNAIHCPTLVICGEEDRITPPKFSRYLRDSIAGSELVMVPDAGHMVQIEQPGLVSEAMRRFWGNIRRAG